MPMLDKEEYERIYKLYGECFNNRKKYPHSNIDELFEPVRKEYEHMTGYADCHHNAILHHRMSRYGDPCKYYGKTLRSPKASYCVYCLKPVDPKPN